MKIAVTGASGFVGRHVLANLVGRNIDVVAVTRDASSLQGLSRSIRIVEMDISAPPQDCFESMGCPDELIHLAWGELSNYQSLAHFETVLPAHYRFLKSLIQSGLSSLLVTGTCLEYGMQSGQLSEEDTRCQHTPYGYAKHALRTQLELFHKIHHFCLKWARLFYMFRLLDL